MRNAYGRFDEDSEEILTSPDRKPLTSEQYMKALGLTRDEMVCSSSTLRRVVRAIEAAHGIKEPE